MKPGPGRLLRGLVLRFMVCAAAFAALSVASGAAIERAVLPWLATTLRLIDPDHRIEDLALRHTAAGRIVELTVTRQRYVFVGGHVLEPDPALTATVSTLAGGVRLTLVLVMAGAFAVPVGSGLARAVHLLLAAAAALLGLALDLPVVLAAAIHGLYLNAFDPLAWTPLQAWSDFMLGGGRLLVPLALGGTVAIIGRAVVRQGGARRSPSLLDGWPPLDPAHETDTPRS